MADQGRGGLDGAGGSTPGRRSSSRNPSATPVRTAGRDRRGADQPAAAPAETPRASRRSRRGLDWFVFFVADIQTGFGPFVAVFLTTQKWTQVDIGLVLTVSGLVALVGQIPAGMLVDAVKSVKWTAALAVVAIGLAAFALAAWPIFLIVIVSRVLHAGASAVLGFSIATLSLGLVGRDGISARLGRNASFASAGTGIAAAAMGAIGYYLSNRAVFFVAAALIVPALVALFRIRSGEVAAIAPEEPSAATDPSPESRSGSRTSGLAGYGARILPLLTNRPLIIFAACVVMFHLANAAMLPLAASMLTLRSSQAASVMVAGAIVVPQFIVAVLSPWVGMKAETWGRRPLLIIGFAALPIRAVLFSMTNEPFLLVAIQVLDGVSAAVLGVLLPLTIADATRRSGHFNLAQGTVGCAMGIGASISTTLVGYVADGHGSHTAFLMLAGIACAGFVLVALAMPETRQAKPRRRRG